jgi:predicted N-formylglutamate amidohydrolase
VSERSAGAVQLIVTCEHGGNRIPRPYWPLFKHYKAALASHRGFDPGALSLARDVAKHFDAELIYSTTSRLLVELNRSPNHRQVLSEATRSLSREERQALVDRYYWPYRNWVESQVEEAIARRKRVFHLSCHSFTPRMNGVTRNADIGLLYDPRRARERAFCLEWQERIEAADPTLKVRRNYPYRGSADGLTTHLRRLHPNREYAGIEIEVNQKRTMRSPAHWRALREVLVHTLEQVLTQLGM